NARGDPDIEFLAGRQPDALFRALDRFFQRYGHGNAEIEIERDAAGIELEIASAGPRAARARIAAGETLETRLAVGIDFAAVELLAPVLVADDLVGRIQLGKTRRGFRIVL